MNILSRGFTGITCWTGDKVDRIERQIISSLLGGNSSIWEVIDSQDASLPEFFDKIKELEKKGIIERDDGIVKLTEKGKKLARDLKYLSFKCKHCVGTGYEMMKEIKEEYEEIIKERPIPVEKYDQGYISKEAILRRISFMIERGDIYSDIFVVGDDDLFSIALALTNLPKKIVVVDIDERLINFINKTADRYNFNIEAHVQDLQEENEKFWNKFDVFVTDPVETLVGIKLFLSRSVASLKGKGSVGYFGLTTLEASYKKWYEIQKMIYRMGFVITDIRRQFYVYPDDGSNFFQFQNKLPIVKKLEVKSNYNWYKSSLYRIEAIKEPKPLIKGNVKLGKRLYRDKESWATPL